MSLAVVPYAVAHEPGVHALNARIASAGGRWAFYARARPRWLAAGEAEATWREFFVAEDETGTIRGGCGLRRQRLAGSRGPAEMAALQGPISEGAVDRRWGGTALAMIRNMEARADALFAWGAADRLTQLLRRLGWREYSTPFFLRLADPAAGLRELEPFRRPPWRRRLARLLAASGGGALLVHGAQSFAAALAGGPPGRAEVEIQDRFGDWADEVWRDAASAYGLIGVRDARTLNAVHAPSVWPDGAILRVRRRGQIVGWAAVRLRAFADDSRFGDLRLGTIVDSLALPGSEAAVVAAASRHLLGAGAQLLLAGHSHRLWSRAFSRNGYIAAPRARTLSATPAMSSLLGPAGPADLHLTLMDGDGPHGF